MEAAIEARVREMGVVIQGGPADMRARGFVEDMLVNAIVVGPEHRTVIETAVAEIAKSVAEIGLTNPVAVRRMEGGRPYLIAGRQRLEAFKRLKRETIRVIVFDDNDMQAKLRKLDENLCRAELSPAEEAAAEYERSHRPAPCDRAITRGSPNGLGRRSGAPAGLHCE